MKKHDELNESQQFEKYNEKTVDLFFELLNTFDKITADDFARICRRDNVPPLVIGRNSPKLFKSFKAQGYLKKTKTYRISQRNHSPMPVYQVVKKPTALT